MDITRILLWTFFSVSVLAGVRGTPTDVKSISACEGENITLWTQLQNDSHTILSADSVTLLNFDNGSVLHKKDNILLDMKRGSIIMLDVKMKDHKVYELQIYDSNGQRIIQYIKLNVTKYVPHISNYTRPSPRCTEPRNHVAAFISVSLTVTLTALILVARFKK